MKIQKEQQTFIEKRRQSNVNTANNSQTFMGFIKQSETKLSDKMINELLDKIEQQGNRLVAAQTVKDFQAYKKLIHEFVQETVSNGLSLKESRSWFQQGGPKYSIVKKIDDKLLELTDHILSKEQDGIRLLDQIGELKGLLINLYQ